MKIHLPMLLSPSSIRFATSPQRLGAELGDLEWAAMGRRRRKKGTGGRNEREEEEEGTRVQVLDLARMFAFS